jgi:tetratricopeptide (TPR) repeat protein
MEDMLQTTHIVIRPKQPLHWLAMLGFVAIGVLTANQIYGAGAWVFAAAYIALSVGFLCDKIVFDGATLKRCGPGAWLLAQLGKPCELSLDAVEAISSYAGQASGETLKFQTIILGEGVGWSINSSEPTYQAFIKALFKAVNPQLLDPLSTELLLYWREAEPLLTLPTGAARTARHLERWRRKAIRLSLDGLHEAAASYFKIAHEQAPHDAQIAYDIGRFLRRRAIALGALSQRGEADLLRAETYFRMAGRLARTQKNARILERVGEAFYEFHHLEAAQKYFEWAAKFDPVRPRANIGLAGIALQNAQGARAVYAYNQAVHGAVATGAIGLSTLAARKSEYYGRLMSDDSFLSAEAGWGAVLNQLKWAQRAALLAFLGFWMLQLTRFEFLSSVRMLSREISATALILWICTFAARQIILVLRRS